MSYTGNSPAQQYITTVKDTFNGDNSTTDFTLSRPALANNLEVFVEHVQQEPTTAYTVSGTTISFTSAPPTGTGNIYVIHRGQAVQTVVPPNGISLNATDATITGAVTVGDGLTVDNDGATVATFDRATSDGTIIELQKDGSSVGAIGNAVTNLNIDATASNRVGIALGGGIVPRYNQANTDNAVDLGNGTYRFKNLYLSGGVYLGGTGAANYLDDYEEGTWSPTVTTDGSSTGIASITNAEYIKIGSVVHLHCQINLNSAGRLTSGTDISGQPFTASRYGGGTYSGASSTSYGGIGVVFTSVFKLREDLKTATTTSWYVTITYHTSA